MLDTTSSTPLVSTAVASMGEIPFGGALERSGQWRVRRVGQARSRHINAPTAPSYAFASNVIHLVAFERTRLVPDP